MGNRPERHRERRRTASSVSAPAMPSEGALENEPRAGRRNGGAKPRRIAGTLRRGRENDGSSREAGDADKVARDRRVSPMMVVANVVLIAGRARRPVAHILKFRLVPQPDPARDHTRNPPPPPP